MIYVTAANTICQIVRVASTAYWIENEEIVIGAHDQLK
jgi:uncharacterized membrane protein YdbT with pleckstrin-like domain